MIRKETILYIFLCLMFSQQIFGQTGHEIKVQLNGFENDTLLLGYQYADKQYIKDTVFRADDSFTFSGDESLDCGMYLIIMPPENKYLQIVIAEDQQHFSLVTNTEDPVSTAKFTNSSENDIFYSYLQYICLLYTSPSPRDRG